MVNSEELSGTTEHMMLQTRCHIIITGFDYVLFCSVSDIHKSYWKHSFYTAK
jgi:hypothetical protein